MTEPERPRSQRVQAFLLSGALRGIAVSEDPADRLAYSHDASFAAMRRAGAGTESVLPDAVAWPEDAGEVVRLVQAAIAAKVPLVPWGGGSGIVGGALALEGGIAVDFKRMNRILEVDEVSRTARVQPGIIIRILEDRLNDAGYTCGHHPQSMNSATIGGAIAHRGAGFKSTRYGKIEDLVLGLDAVVPPGEVLHLKGIARNSNGPDLRHLVIGGEGRMGLVTEATVQIFPLPQASRWQSFLFETFEQGLDGLRGLMQSGVLPAMVRLFDQPETEAVFGADFPEAQGSLLIVLWEGLVAVAEAETEVLARRSRDLGGRELGEAPGAWWWERRLSTAALLRIQHAGGFSDTIEVAAPWSRAFAVYRAMLTAMREAAGPGATVFGHVAHAYPTGTDIYMVLLGREPTGAAGVARHRAVIRAAVEGALGEGGTLSHHHGIGTLRRDFLEDEFGQAGFRLLTGLSRLVDPDGVLNPGKLGREPAEAAADPHGAVDGAATGADPADGAADALTVCRICHDQCAFVTAEAVSSGRQARLTSRKALIIDRARRGRLDWTPAALDSVYSALNSGVQHAFCVHHGDPAGWPDETVYVREARAAIVQSGQAPPYAGAVREAWRSSGNAHGTGDYPSEAAEASEILFYADAATRHWVPAQGQALRTLCRMLAGRARLAGQGTAGFELYELGFVDEAEAALATLAASLAPAARIVSDAPETVWMLNADRARSATPRFPPAVGLLRWLDGEAESNRALGLRPTEEGATLRGARVAYQDPTYLGRYGDGDYDLPRRLIRDVLGSAPSEMRHAREQALPTGPTLGYPSEADRVEIARSRLEQARASGAEVVVTASPFDFENLRRARAPRMTVRYLPALVTLAPRP